MIDYRNYLVTDDPSRYKGNWLDNIVAAVEGGVTVVQYRDTESSPSVMFDRVRKLQDALNGRVPLVINNEAELATAVKAQGIHVGQNDLPPKAVRAIVGNSCEIGLSITHKTQVQTMLHLHERGFVDAIGIGPVFDATKTKSDAAPEMGIDGLREITNLCPEVPNCAIGGVTLERAPAIINAGAKGLAIVSAYSKSSDPFATARAFRALFA